MNMIDRFSLVRRNNPVLTAAEPLSALSVGNGEFAFTADITGLQTFPQEYKEEMPLCTLSNWGWHSYPLPKEVETCRLIPKEYDTYGRKVGYYSSSRGQEKIFHYLRQNPHRFHLGNIGFELCHNDGKQARLEELTEIRQELDMYTGVLYSSFTFDGCKTEVETCCHPERDQIAVKVNSPLTERKQLAVSIIFPYGSHEMSAGDWLAEEKHCTVCRYRDGTADIRRTMDGTQYFVKVAFPESKFDSIGRHKVLFRPEHSSFSFTVSFSLSVIREKAETFLQTAEKSAHEWKTFWENGGAVDFSQCKDLRAQELERRVVCSQYLTKIQCSGSVPPQETGLTVNSWFGKAHLEMYWWHAAHFALWGRERYLENGLDWYCSFLHKAKERAQMQGYRGARWPKMVDHMAQDSPSNVAALLIWQQPHPIFLAELVYRSCPTTEILQRYAQIVFESAIFMADFVHREKNGRFVLGPPYIPAQENHKADVSYNAAYEVEYWYYALGIAQQWRKRMGKKESTEWEEIRRGLAPVPEKEGVYLAHEHCPDTFENFNIDHPAMLNACGVLPGTRVDGEKMAKTLQKVLKIWNLPSTWGWDYPVMAMTAARTGYPELAVDCLLLDVPKNHYSKSGNNYQRPNLPLYLPGNGGLLAAVAMMAAGWDGCGQKEAPGFPKNGLWEIRAEGLKPYV